MTENTELKRLARRVIDIEALDGGEPIGEAWGEFEAAATPAAVLALIAENDQLKKDRRTEHQSLRSDKARNSLYMMIATSIIDDHPYERTGSDWDYEHPIHDKIISFLAERDQLRAEVAGLRTGYEAYERVNAELKAELAAEIQRRFDGNEIAARERDEEVRKLKAENEALRKDAERFRYWRRCWANEEDANLPYSVEMQMDSNGDFEIEDAFDAAMGKGEQS